MKFERHLIIIYSSVLKIPTGYQIRTIQLTSLSKDRMCCAAKIWNPGKGIWMLYRKHLPWNSFWGMGVWAWRIDCLRRSWISSIKSTAWEARVHKLKKICSHYFWAFQLPVVDHAKDHSPTHPKRTVHKHILATQPLQVSTQTRNLEKDIENVNPWAPGFREEMLPQRVTSFMTSFLGCEFKNRFCYWKRRSVIKLLVNDAGKIPQIS